MIKNEKKLQVFQKNAKNRDIKVFIKHQRRFVCSLGWRNLNLQTKPSNETLKLYRGLLAPGPGKVKMMTIIVEKTEKKTDFIKKKTKIRDD